GDCRPATSITLRAQRCCRRSRRFSTGTSKPRVEGDGSCGTAIASPAAFGSIGPSHAGIRLVLADRERKPYDKAAPMATEFKMTHRVEFADTDMAGLIHFSSYFRYMEVTEHAFFRSLGLSIVLTGGEKVGWPRVHVDCDFKGPLYFENEVEVHLRVRTKGERSL